jgi:hypothetical protein
MQLLKKISKLLFLQEKKRTKKDDKQVEFLNYSELSTVLVLCCINKDSDFEEIKAVSGILSRDNKKVTICCYVSQKNSLLQDSENQFFIKKESLSYKGKPNNEVIKRLKNGKFDAAFNISLRMPVPLLYALLHSQAKIKCGCKMAIDGLLNFVIDMSNSFNINEKYLLEQIIYYLKIVNK